MTMFATSLTHTSAATEYRLRQHLAWAHRNCAFYRDRIDPKVFEAADGLSRFTDIPFVGKTDVIDDQAAAPPFGTGLCVDPTLIARVFASVGSLVTPMTEPDLVGVAHAYAAGWRHLGIGPGDVVDVATTYHRALGGTVLDASFRDVGAAVIPGGPGETGERLRLLHTLGVTVLQAFTPYAEHLAEAAIEAGLDPRSDLNVRLLLVGGEYRDAAAKARLADLWGGATIAEGYGAAEVGCVAWECAEAADGMHILGDTVVEVVDPDSGEPTDGANGGELVLTELYRQAQPWIRFRTGDIVESVTYGRCECGRTSPRLGRLVGRRSNILRVRGLFVSISLLSKIASETGVSNLRRVTVSRDATLDEIAIELGADAADSRRIDEAQRVSDRIRQVLGLRTTVSCGVDQQGSTDVEVIDERDGSRRAVPA